MEQRGSVGAKTEMGGTEKVLVKMRKNTKLTDQRKAAGPVEEVITNGSVRKEVVKVVEKAKD